jgi:hypothetical protein
MEMTPKMQEAKKWIISSIAASITGGISAAITTAMDPAKYKFPQDFGSGKLWPSFLAGTGAVFLGMLLRSPMGQKLIGTYKDTQAQLAQNQKELDQAKAEIKSAGLPPPEKAKQPAP